MSASRALAIAFVMVVASLLLATVHPFGDPERNLQQPREELLENVSMPDAARRTLIEKCADCHSNATHWPVYSRAAPASWLIERDVIEGRRHLNLSRWKEFSPDQQQAFEQEIALQAKKGAMPPLQYRLVHWTARLETSDRDALTNLVAHDAGGVGPARAGDADRGRALFGRRCSGCHATDSDREGPRLRGVYGRRAGSVAGFRYSSAVKDSGITWNEANLERWLTDTDAMLPRNAMGFAVPKAQERADLIAFLKSLR